MKIGNTIFVQFNEFRKCGQRYDRKFLNLYYSCKTSAFLFYALTVYNIKYPTSPFFQ